MSRILVVDTDFACMDIVSFLLESEGFQVEGYESLSRVLSVCGYDLIILGEDLNGESGSSVCKTLKETPELIDVRVILTVDQAQLRYIEANCNADFLLVKPFASSQLESAVANVLRREVLEEAYS